MDILIKAEEILSVTKYKSGKACLWVGGFQKVVEIPEHGDLVQLNDALDCFSEDDVVAQKALRKIPVVLERTT